MNRFFTLFLAASCLTAVGQCCDPDSFEVLGPAPCLGDNNWASDGVVCDPDCGDYNPCIPGGECYDPNSPVCTIVGCTDETACNYNVEANTDDGSCAEIDACGFCGGPGAVYDCGCSDIPEGNCDCLGNQEDVLGICGGFCEADLDDDGLCDANDPCVGTFDNCGVCNGPGPILECGCAEIPEGDCDCDGNILDECGVCGGDGITNGECDCDGNVLDECGVCGGDNYAACTDVVACNYDPGGSCDNGSCEYESCAGCLDSEACNYDPQATLDSGSCLFLDALEVCGGDCLLDDNNNGICDNEDIVGCTYQWACNFDSYATYDDGSCDLDSCKWCDDESACNYEGPGLPWHEDPSLCEYPGEGVCDCDGNQFDAIGTCGGSCLEDIDQDGVCDDVDYCVGELDECGVCNGPGANNACGCADIPEGDCDCDENVLDVLGVCGGNCTSDINNNGVCDAEEVPGCTYAFAQNYNPAATDDDGSCMVSECNPQEEYGCNLEGDLNDDGFVGASDLLDLLVQFGAECISETAFVCGDLVSYQGYDYATVLIGNQCWFAENLRAENYGNGDAIFQGVHGLDWFDLSEGGFILHPEDELSIHGKLYNWFAIQDARNLCPIGWSIPSEDDFLQLYDNYGSTQEASSALKSAGTIEGGDGLWYEPNLDATNSSGFTAIPSGQYTCNQQSGGWCIPLFQELGYFNYMWTRTAQDTENARHTHLYSYAHPSEGLPLVGNSKNNGLSIRCIKDSE